MDSFELLLVAKRRRRRLSCVGAVVRERDVNVLTSALIVLTAPEVTDCGGYGVAHVMCRRRSPPPLMVKMGRLASRGGRV